MKNRKRKLFISVIILLLMSGCSEANIKIKIDSISLATEQTETTVNSIPTESFIPITTEFPTQTPVQPSTQVPTETQTEISTESPTVYTTEQSSEGLSTEQPTEKSTPEHIKEFVDLPRYGMITMSCKGTVFHNLDNSLEEVELSPDYHVNILFEKAEHYIISWYNDDTAQVKKECIELYDINSVGIAKCPSDYIGFEIIE